MSNRRLATPAGAAPDTASSPGLDANPSRILTWVTVVSAAVAALVTLLATARGPGLTPDSINYFSAGLSLASGDGLITFNGATLVQFPPGLPALLALAAEVGVGPDTASRVFNAVAYAATVVIASVLLRRHVRSTKLVCGAVILVAVDVTLLGIAQMAWTESLFVLVSVAFVLALERLCSAVRPAAWIVAAAVLVWMGFLLRYAGIALLPAGAIAVLLGRQRQGWRHAFGVAFAFGVVSLVAPLAWMARNLAVHGTLLGSRSPSPDDLVTTVQRFVAILGRWIVPSPVPVVIQAVCGAAFVVAVAAAFVWIVANPVRRRAFGQGGATDADDTRDLRSLLPLVCIVVVYSGYIIAAQLTAAFDPINSRLLSPLFVPLVVLVAVGLERGRAVVPAAARRTTTTAVSVVLVVLLIAQAGLAVRLTWISGRDGVGYSTAQWQDSELAGLAEGVPRTAHLYSNVPAGLWSVLRRGPLHRAPEKHQRRSPIPIPMSEEFLRTVRCDTTFLAWSDHGEGDFLFTPEELAEYVQLEVIAEAADGTLYRLTPLPAEVEQGPPC